MLEFLQAIDPIQKPGLLLLLECGAIQNRNTSAGENFMAGHYNANYPDQNMPRL